MICRSLYIYSFISGNRNSVISCASPFSGCIIGLYGIPIYRCQNHLSVCLNRYPGSLAFAESHGTNSCTIRMNIHISIRIDDNGILLPISAILSTDADLSRINIYISDICHSNIAADCLNGVIIRTERCICCPDINGIHITYINGPAIPYIQPNNRICCNRIRNDVQSAQFRNV